MYLMRIHFIVTGFFILFALALQGCGVSYNVKVDGFTDPIKQFHISPGSTIYVIEDKNTKNPLLEKEVVTKINIMLKLKGYNTEELTNPKYYLLYGYGIGHERTITSTMPVYTPGKTATVTKTGPSGTSYSTIQIPSTTTYVPYSMTITDKWLSIKVVDGDDYRASGKDNVIWIGEASVTEENRDIRSTINYLIAAMYYFFGENTGKTVNINIKENNPVLKTLLNR
ncbi:MAG TPA: hypothetical protein PLM71_11290 [Syntrophorhabdaceae bacterium]|mgnify:CR=1 FL=1|nr:hypothetical protein [Syntrophorhabdaceae bacterium]